MLLMLSGAIGAGKDTFADFLLDAFDMFQCRAELKKFADPIRNVAFAMGFNPDDRNTKETPFLRVYKLSDLSDEVFKAFPLLTPYERRIVACKVHQRLINIRRERHQGIYYPVVSTREFMQVVGGAVREADVDYYIKHLKSNTPNSQVNVVSDCRFINEQAVGDYSVYVVRPDNPHFVNTLDSSEAAQALLRGAANKVIENSGTKDELYETAVLLAADLINSGKCDGALKLSGGTGSPFGF